MERRFIQVKELRKLINELLPHFPCKTEFIDIFYLDNNLTINIVDKNKNDATGLFLSKSIDGTSLFELILSRIKANEKIIVCIEKDFVYSYKVKNIEKKPLYLNPDVFRKLRNKDGYTMMGLADTIGISYNTLQTIENSAPIDHSISHVVKYSLFFKHNILEFFDKGLSKELTKIMLGNYVAKGLISEDVYHSIIANEFKS